MTASPSAQRLRLGVNIDHVATIRNARGGEHPDPVRAAEIVAAVGGDGITAHLREDRRHIRDEDIASLSIDIDRPLNLEMAATPEMVEIALRHKPHAVCLVPEKREELTTEGGLDVAGQLDKVGSACETLAAQGIRVSLFIDPDERQLDAAKAAGAPVVEIHTGAYADADETEAAAELERIVAASAYGDGIGLTVHAGHGLHY